MRSCYEYDTTWLTWYNMLTKCDSHVCVCRFYVTLCCMNMKSSMMFHVYILQGIYPSASLRHTAGEWEASPRAPSPATTLSQPKHDDDNNQKKNFKQHIHRTLRNSTELNFRILLWAHLHLWDFSPQIQWVHPWASGAFATTFGNERWLGHGMARIRHNAVLLWDFSSSILGPLWIHLDPSGSRWIQLALL